MRGVSPPPPMEMRQRRAQGREDHGVDTTESECGNWVCRVAEEESARAGLAGNAGVAGARCGREAAPRASARLCVSAKGRACAFVHMYLVCVCKRHVCVCVDARLCQRAWASDYMTAQHCVQLPRCSEVTRPAPNPSGQNAGRGLRVTVLVFVD